MFVFGSCRVVGAVRSFQPLSKDQYIQTHYVAEVIQAVQYLRGEVQVPASTFRNFKNVAVHGAKWVQMFKQARNIVIEISSLKEVLSPNGWYVNLLAKTSDMKVTVLKPHEVRAKLHTLLNLLSDKNVILVGHGSPKGFHIAARKLIDTLLYDLPQAVIVSTLFDNDTECFDGDFNHYIPEMFERLGSKIKAFCVDTTTAP